MRYDETELLRKYGEERAKRLRKDAEEQFQDAAGDFSEFADDPYIDEPLQREAIVEDLDVVVVGGGVGGMLTAVGLRKRGINSFRIIEQAGDFGGTWYWNRYPGVRCDIESLIYMPLLEETGVVPTEHYATGGEIFEHCRRIGRHFDLYAQTLFQTKVTRIEWDEALARWTITTDRGDTLRARHITLSQGPLAKVKLPGIPGIRDFKGKMFHSARWDYEYTGGDQSGGTDKLGTKRVAIIGTGATAVQIVPRIVKHTKELLLFQRTPSAVDRRGNKPVDPAWLSSLPKGWQRERMENFTEIVVGHPQDRDTVGDQWTDFWKRLGARMKENAESGRNDDPYQVMQRVDIEKMEELRARIAEVVEDPATAKVLTPWYNYLCKRPLYSDDYLESFNEPNVELVDTDGRGVEKITEDSVIANGKRYEVDCIIFATGFDVGAAAHVVGGYELLGRKGQTVDEKWADGIRTLHGMYLHGFPNLHIVGGIAQGVTVFNFTHSLSIQSEHAVNVIQRCFDDGIAIMDVSSDAEARWLKTMEENENPVLSRYFAECTPGFLNNEGDDSKPSFIGSAFGGGPLVYEGIINSWSENGLEVDAELTYETELKVQEDATA